MKVKRSWELLSEEEKKKAIDSIINHFMAERDEVIGVIAAEEILDNILENISITLYNKGVEDAINKIKNRIESFLIEVEAESKK